MSWNPTANHKTIPTILEMAVDYSILKMHK